jgi:putative SOS response-associated peptidase YedK
MAKHTDSLTMLALRALEEIEQRTQMGTVELTRSDRVVLEWLVRAGIAERWQVGQFIEALAAPISNAIHDGGDHYIRSTAATTALEAWHGKAGIKRLDCVRRSIAARRYFVEMLDPEDGQPQPWHMCNRYHPGDRDTISRLFAATPARPFNDGPPIVHPREPGFVVRRHEGALVLDQMTWGFPVILHGKKGQPLKPKPVNNARFDKLDKFWGRWSRNPAHRCLVPAAHYAEAEGPSGKMRTTWLSLKSAPVFAWAGLWAKHEDWGPVYTCVMTDNAPELADIHDRSPIILAPEDWETWLTAPLDELRRFDRPWPANDVNVVRTTVPWAKGGREDAYFGAMPPAPWL